MNSTNVGLANSIQPVDDDDQCWAFGGAGQLEDLGTWCFSVTPTVHPSSDMLFGSRALPHLQVNDPLISRQLQSFS